MQKEHLAYCGYDCSECPVYKATMSNNLEELKCVLFAPHNKEHTIESLGCYGCNDPRSKNHMCSNCFIKNCATSKKIKNCGYCDEFPCNYLKNYISVNTMMVLKEINGKKEG